MPGKLAARVRGLSEDQVRAAFGTEEQCRAVLERLRWPKGFVCPSCGHGGRAWLAARQLYQCNRCKHQVSLTAGTIFHATKLPLTTWFLAIHLIVTAKNGISSIELGRRLGVKQTTAWAMKQKIMQVMQEREAKKPKAGSSWTTPIWVASAAASGAGGPRARRPWSRRWRPQPSAGPKSSSCWR